MLFTLTIFCLHKIEIFILSDVASCNQNKYDKIRSKLIIWILIAEKKYGGYKQIKKCVVHRRESHFRLWQFLFFFYQRAEFTSRFMAKLLCSFRLSWVGRQIGSSRSRWKHKLMIALTSWGPPWRTLDKTYVQVPSSFSYILIERTRITNAVVIKVHVRRLKSRK